VSDEVQNGLLKLIKTGEMVRLEKLALEKIKPDFDLIEPASIDRGANRAAWSVFHPTLSPVPYDYVVNQTFWFCTQNRCINSLVLVPCCDGGNPSQSSTYSLPILTSAERYSTITADSSFLCMHVD
jgi:hypothetical protein